jgi:Asp-tRNA(Asn)/Glu-tRNA(Gln) amidotransferase A subunit family amidase
MSKKWYSYFVSVDAPDAPAGESAGPDAPSPSAPSAAQTIAEIAASVKPAPAFTQPVANPASFDEIYQAAEIPTPTQGFTIFKIAEMLKSEHIRTLSVEIKRSSVLLALDAAGVKLQDVIEDAVRRDRALDTFELVQQRALDQLEAKKAEENKKLQADADRILNELRAKIQANNDEVAKERERMQTWRLQKQQEERRIADAVAPFTTQNPVTVGPVAPAPAKPVETPGH